MVKLYAGFIKAERRNELVTTPVFCIGDDEAHARRTLTTWAKEKWPKEKGWTCQQGWCREIPDEVLFMDDRVKALLRIIQPFALELIAE